MLSAIPAVPYICSGEKHCRNAGIRAARQACRTCDLWDLHVSARKVAGAHAHV